jgi:hypothetical protein
MTIKFHSYDIKEERTWVPSPPEFRVGHNPNYLQSLVAGVFSPILHLPQIFWFNSIWPFLRSLAGALSFIGVSFIAGIMGRANGVRTVSFVPREATVAEKERALSDLLAGSGYVAVPVNAMPAGLLDITQGKEEDHH